MTGIDIAHNQREQALLYGEPLGDLLRSVMGTLGLNQAAAARILGLSAPMLSQLMSAQRVKIANPVVAHRLEQLLDLAQQAAAGTIDDVETRLADIEVTKSTVSSRLSSATHRAPSREGAIEVLRGLASSAELSQAAGAAPHSALADLLREAAREGQA